MFFIIFFPFDIPCIFFFNAKHCEERDKGKRKKIKKISMSNTEEGKKKYHFYIKKRCQTRDEEKNVGIFFHRRKKTGFFSSPISELGVEL
jgi:hypothetical protein